MKSKPALEEVREYVVGHSDEDPFDLLYMFFVGLVLGNQRLTPVIREQIEECRTAILKVIDGESLPQASHEV